MCLVLRDLAGPPTRGAGSFTKPDPSLQATEPLAVSEEVKKRYPHIQKMYHSITEPRSLSDRVISGIFNQEHKSVIFRLS